MLRFDLDNENKTIHHYRYRVRQCEAMGEYALADHIGDILVQEQDHQIALANALGGEIPNVERTGERSASTPRTCAGMTCGTSKASVSSIDKSTGVSNNRAEHCCVVLGF